MSGLWLVSYVTLWVLFLLLSVILIGVMRNLGVVYTTLSAGIAATPEPSSKLRRGQEVPDVVWVTAHGEPRPISAFKGVRHAFKVVKPGCEPCELELRRMADEGPDPMDRSLRSVVVVSLGDPKGTADLLARAGLGDDIMVLFDSDNQTADRWGISATPATVVVDERLVVVRQIFGNGATRGTSPNGSIEGTAAVGPWRRN